MSASNLGEDPRDGAPYVFEVGEGVPVVLLHSTGMSGDQWRKTAEGLARAGLQAIVPDLLGSGRSTPWPEGVPFSYLDDVAAVARLLERVGRPVHLVGHSYGGWIALAVAAQAPRRALSLALYDPVAFGVLEPERDAEALADRNRLAFHWGTKAEEHDAWLRSFVDYWGGEGSWARLRESARAEFRRVGWIAYEGARTLVADTTRASAYAALAVPTLLMTGESTPPAAQRVVERLGEAIPGARVKRIAGAGHMGPLTHARLVGEHIARHLGLPSTA